MSNKLTPLPTPEIEKQRVFAFELKDPQCEPHFLLLQVEELAERYNCELLNVYEDETIQGPEAYFMQKFNADKTPTDDVGFFLQRFGLTDEQAAQMAQDFKAESTALQRVASQETVVQ